MANPQIQDGYTRIANEIIEDLIKINLSSYQTRVLLFIFRKTYGYGKKEDWISVSQIVTNTGILKSHVSRAKSELLKRHLVTSNGNKISFQKDSSLWVELPKKVTITNTSNKVTSTGQKVTNTGQELPVQGHTKETIQKKLTKEILTKVNTGNPDINYLHKYIKEKLELPVLDETIAINRRYCWLLLKKFGDREKVIMIIDAVSVNEFWRYKITSFKTLYYKAVQIISSTRDKPKVAEVTI